MDDPTRKRTDNDTQPEPNMAPLTEHMAQFCHLFGVLDKAYEDMKAEAQAEQDNEDKRP